MKIIAALLFFAVATPANANWQYTHWGMTPAEVAAAAPIPIAMVDSPEISTENSQIKAGVIYEASGLKFVAGFGFDRADKLNRVMLSPRQLSRCSELHRMLRSVYGEPSESGTQNSTIYFASSWRDEKEGNLVNFLSIGDWNNPRLCTAQYEPILSRKGSGL